MKKPFEIWGDAIRPNDKNATQTLASVVCDPEFYDSKFSGKVFSKHSTENLWNDSDVESEPYLHMVTQGDVIDLLNKTAAAWTDVENRKKNL